jgi:hypothetical protein
MSERPLAFFAHHQGRGHANRIMAILEHIPEDRPVIIMTAAPSQFDDRPRDATMVELPNMIGAPSRSPALHDQPTPEVMHCVPLGVEEMRQHMGLIAQTLREADPVEAEHQNAALLEAAWQGDAAAIETALRAARDPATLQKTLER